MLFFVSTLPKIRLGYEYQKKIPASYWWDGGAVMLKSYQEMLEYAFDVLNEVYFNSELPPIVITLQSSPRTNGHYTVGEEWRVDNDRLHEINISVEHIDRPVENVIATLCHELTHYYCALNGIQDTSQYGRYHNKNFKIEAEKRGLSISYHQGIGWSVTEPTPEFVDVLKRYGIEKPIDINRDGCIGAGAMIGIAGTGGATGGDGGLAVKKPKCSTRKYVCPSCGNSFRATKELNVMCMDCMEQFMVVPK